MHVSIRNYCAIERADLDLERIALVAARNEQGKTCVAEAVQAVLSGVPITRPGVTKKDAAILVKDGANSCTIMAADGDQTAIVELPKGAFVGKGATDLRASPVAVGLVHPCIGTGVTRSGQPCIHGITCSCPKCSPYCLV